MSFFCRLSRKHYWSIPHRNDDKHLVQVCYECGSERLAHDLHAESSDLATPKPAPSKPAVSGSGMLRKLEAVK